MIIHIVSRGETAYSIATNYNISYERFIFDNQISDPDNLVVGQSLLILIPELTHKVAQNESLYTISNMYGISVNQILRNNPYLSLKSQLEVGQSIVIRYSGSKIGNIIVNGYAYPFINLTLLNETLPYLSKLSIFSYGFTPEGGLIPVDDNELINISVTYGVKPILVLTPFGPDGKFNNSLVSAVTNNADVRQNLINNLITTVQNKGYTGVDVDFEYILSQDRYSYAMFVGELRSAMNALGYEVSVALAPKTSSQQKGLLYEGIDYQLLGQNADSVLLMTYEWGYKYGPPMAVAPINKVREVLDYAITEIPANKIDMGIPNYGYDWTLPFVRGMSEARVIGNVEAVRIAHNNNAIIKFDNLAMSPYFEYIKNGISHIVWFEDCRSIQEKLNTIAEYGFRGAGYWNLMHEFRQNWLILNNLFNIEQ